MAQLQRVLACVLLCALLCGVALAKPCSERRSCSACIKGTEIEDESIEAPVPDVVTHGRVTESFEDLEDFEEPVDTEVIKPKKKKITVEDEETPVVRTAWENPITEEEPVTTVSTVAKVETEVEACAWCGATKKCVSVRAIPYKATNSESLDHPFYASVCPSNWRVDRSVWESDKYGAINWATDEQCENDEEEEGAELKQTLGFEAESRVLYQARGKDAADKHSKLFTIKRNQITLDMTSSGERDIEFVMFPPVTISDNGFTDLTETTDSMKAVAHTIGEETLAKYTELKSQKKLKTKEYDFTHQSYSPLKHQQEVDLPWVKASALKPSLEGRFMNRFDFLKQRDTYLQTLTEIKDKPEQKADPVLLPDSFTTDSEEVANTVLTGVQVTASIPLNRVVDLFSLPGTQFRLVGSSRSNIHALATCVRKDTLRTTETGEADPEFTKGWTDEFQGFITLLTYYTSSFRDTAIDRVRATCQLINPKNDVLQFNIRSTFYDMIRAVKHSFKGEATFPVASAEDLIELVKKVQTTCIPRTSRDVCTFEEIKLGGHEILSKGGKHVTIGQWLTSIMEGPYDMLNDAHMSLATFPTQFRASTPAAIIEFRDPDIVSSIPAGKLTTAMTVFFDFFKTFLVNKSLQSAVDRMDKVSQTLHQICNVQLLTKNYIRLRAEKPIPTVEEPVSTVQKKKKKFGFFGWR